MTVAESKAIDFSRLISPILLDELVARGIDFAALTPAQHCDAVRDIEERIQQTYMKGYRAGSSAQLARGNKNNLWKSQK